MLRRDFLKSVPPVVLMPQLRSAPRLKITDIRIVNLKSVRETGKMEAAWNPGTVTTHRIGGGAVIMAGSGMCAGGRIRHHLRHNLWRADSSVVFVGFAAAGTLARQIIDGAEEVTIFGERISVRARIHTINGFSAHADQAELLAWQRKARASRTFLVHGEEEAMRGFAGKLVDTQVEIPALGEAFTL